MHTASFSNGPTSWLLWDLLTWCIDFYTLPLFVFEPMKSSSRGHCWYIPNNNHVKLNASASCQYAGRKPGLILEWLLEIQLQNQNLEGKILLPMTLSFCRMFWFSWINSIKAAWMTNVDMCCWKLFTLCFIVILAAVFLRSVTVENLPVMMLIKGIMGKNGERPYKLFLGLFNYGLRSTAWCI